LRRRLPQALQAARATGEPDQGERQQTPPHGSGNARPEAGFRRPRRVQTGSVRDRFGPFGTVSVSPGPFRADQARRGTVWDTENGRKWRKTAVSGPPARFDCPETGWRPLPSAGHLARWAATLAPTRPPVQNKERISPAYKGGSPAGRSGLQRARAGVAQW
jgi:hypothetical protein